MKKVLILITNDNFVRNYINTSALNDLEKNFKCFYLVNKELKTKFKKKKKHLHMPIIVMKKKYSKNSF
jgi:hypothetical protein